MTKQLADPDFYLASSEGYGLEQPRACYRIRRLQIGWAELYQDRKAAEDKK